MSDWWTGAPVVSPAPSPRSVARQPQARRQATPRYSGPMPTGADEVFSSLIAQESGGRAGVRGPQTQYGQALGRTQVLPDTARGIARNIGVPYREDLLTGTSPEAAAYQDQLGRAYLQEGFQNTGNARDALMYYHGGPNRALWGPKTNAYADEVLTRWNQGGGVPAADNMADMPSQSGSDWWASAPVVDPAAANGGFPQEVTINQGTITENGRVYRDGQDLGTVAEYEADQRRTESDREARRARQEDPEYQAALADARRGSENVPDQLRALGLGASYGFLTDINAEAQRAIQGVENIGRRATGQEVRYGADDLAQATRDAMRDDQAAYAAAKPLENFALQLAGGVVAPGAIQGGQFIGTGAGATGRAAAVGGAMGAASGIGYGQGNLIERAPDAAIGGLTGAGTGAIIQGGLNRLGRAGEGGGAARRLSRQGVDLFPGQMVSETPVIGEFVRNIEDVAGGFNPLMMGARRSQNEQVVQAAGNEALSYIGETLPRNARTGYQVSQAVKRVLGDRYDDVTSRITAQADPQVYTELADLTQRASQTLDESGLRRLDRILNDKFVNEFDASGQLSGDNFKRIERALREQSDRASRPTSTLADNDLAEFLDEARDIARGLIARQYPAEAETIQALNRGWATNKIIERAVTGSAGFSRSGTPTPGEISQAVVNSSNLGAIANENALLQGLATDARTVLPSTVPDSGTAQKTVLAATVGALGAGGTAVLSPGLAPLIAAGAVAYSPLGIGFLNAVYRATDSRAANAALRQLADQARRNPSLLPYYEDAVQHALSLSQRDTQAAPRAQPSAQAPSPALQRVLQ